jgi:hypothetical protein
MNVDSWVSEDPQCVLVHAYKFQVEEVYYSNCPNRVSLGLLLLLLLLLLLTPPVVLLFQNVLVVLHVVIISTPPPFLPLSPSPSHNISLIPWSPHVRPLHTSIQDPVPSVLYPHRLSLLSCILIVRTGSDLTGK